MKTVVETRWSRFRHRFIWGDWPWKTLGFYHGSTLVIGKLKIKIRMD